LNQYLQDLSALSQDVVTPLLRKSAQFFRCLVNPKQLRLERGQKLCGVVQATPHFGRIIPKLDQPSERLFPVPASFCSFCHSDVKLGFRDLAAGCLSLEESTLLINFGEATSGVADLGIHALSLLL
jgi:hypothetical protein